NQIIIKYCLPLTAVSFIISLCGFFKEESAQIYLWASAVFSILAITIVYCYTTDKVNQERSDELESIKTEAEKLSKLHYNLHLINPNKELKEQIEYGLKILSETIKEPTFACFNYKNNSLNFIAASRSSSYNEQKNIPCEDPLIKEITNKIKSITDYESLMNSGGNAKPVTFVNDNNVKGQIFTIELYSNVYALLVEIGEDKLEDSESRIIDEFCKGIALVFANYKESNTVNTEKTIQNKEKESDQQLEANLYNTMLPDNLPTIPGWDLAKYFYPSANRADFMDIYNLSTDKYMLLLGKCSGSGINAAMYVNKLKVIIKCFIEDFQSPAKLLNKISRYLGSDLMPDLFVDVTAITFSPLDNQVTVAMAGNTLPIINRTRSGFAEIPELETGIPLGLFNQGTEPYKDQLINIMPGDGIILHTDGITDLPGKGIERFSNEDLKNILDKLPEQDAEDMLNSLVRQIKGKNSNELPEEDHSIIYLKAE
ncbi:MAG: serine/threonine-protein phosphatase, partial [Candidatus Riflebacteria bacterium]|nr:serine/threonine-protein phosphatase [Candidatus Riflebacteria bacterium]